MNVKNSMSILLQDFFSNRQYVMTNSFGLEFRSLSFLECRSDEINGLCAFSRGCRVFIFSEHRFDSRKKMELSGGAYISSDNKYFSITGDSNVSVFDFIFFREFRFFKKNKKIFGVWYVPGIKASIMPSDPMFPFERDFYLYLQHLINSHSH